MGDLNQVHMVSATGDDGRTRHRTSEDPSDQASTAFSEHDRHVLRDPHNDAHVLPVGLGQSLNTKQAKAHKLHGRMKFRNLDVSIENRKGSKRHWYDVSADREGSTLMKYPYGYIRMSEGMDGDHVDCFIGPNEDANFVYIITTNKAPSFKEVDEQKCLLGFNSAKEAKKVFLDHYTNPKFFRSLTILPYSEFEKKVLATRTRRLKKIATNVDDSDQNRTSTGPAHDRTPGDYLGFPSSSLIGLRTVKGDPLSPSDTIDRQFRFNDDDSGTRVLDGNSAAFTESPGV